MKRVKCKHNGKVVSVRLLHFRSYAADFGIINYLGLR